MNTLLKYTCMASYFVSWFANARLYIENGQASQWSYPCSKTQFLQLGIRDFASKIIGIIGRQKHKEQNTNIIGAYSGKISLFSYNSYA